MDTLLFDMDDLQIIANFSFSIHRYQELPERFEAIAVPTLRCRVEMRRFKPARQHLDGSRIQLKSRGANGHFQ
jgi:hypothetical protein